MANVKQIKSEAIALIDAAMSVLNKFPALMETNTELSFNASLNPFEFLMDIFKSIEGYDKLIATITNFIAYEMPEVESNIKVIISEKLKNLISCSVNPILTEEILKEGIVFNVEEIDIADILKFSPFDTKVGKYFYFGIDEARMPDDLVKCDDMDALIWFMVNKANRRYTWKPKDYRKNEEEPRNCEKDSPKKDGIITFEYNERPQSLKNAIGEPYTLQTPYNNCLHVFIGDAREININTLRGYEDTFSEKEKNIKEKNTKIQELEKQIETLEEQNREAERKFNNHFITEEAYKQIYQQNKTKIQNLKTQIENLKSSKNEDYKEKQKQQYQIGEFEFNNGGQTPNYCSNIKKNYYFEKTLLDFDNDYIRSIDLFHPKTIASRLLDALTNMLTIDLAFTYKQQLIRNEIKKMISMIVESDDIVVSDCFFTFSNDDYDSMSRQAELRKAGLLTFNGDETSAVKINAEDILSKLNEINDTATKETIQTVIEGAITEISAELTDTTYDLTQDVNFGVRMNFIEMLLNNLAYSIVCSILSPKIYLLLLINLKIIGKSTNFNLETFLGHYKQLIADLIRSIRDQLIQYLLNRIMEQINDLVGELTLKLGVEQAMYYSRLIKRLLECFKLFKGDNQEIDFNVDEIGYADILPTEEEPKNNDC